jgi:hypothetical protein|tara:strand:+ start:645 stop:1085 length:441 start_codon:yes stop_codon:yes gene_type:complete
MTKEIEKPTLGAPTKYTEDIPQRMIEFFNVPLLKIEQVEAVTKNGVVSMNEIAANELPTIERFCADLMISKSTLHIWIKKYPILSNAYDIAKQCQKNHLLQNGLSGRYNSAFAKFISINCTDLVDKVVTEHQGNIEINIDSEDSGL